MSFARQVGGNGPYGREFSTSYPGQPAAHFFNPANPVIPSKKEFR